MQIAVKHSLQLYDLDDTMQAEAVAWVLPIAEAQAVMGETVKAYLARVAWRLELPTVLTINGEFYARAEWEERALAANDRVEFISRPLGSSSSGGSTAKSILSVVALVALTAVAGPAGPLGTALATAFGSVGGAVASAVIVGAGAASASPWLRPAALWWQRALRRARDSSRAVLAVACRLWSPAP
jgi:sulfur carrier protein ThiS